MSCSGAGPHPLGAEAALLLTFSMAIEAQLSRSATIHLA